MQCLEGFGLPLSGLRGQGYDVASTMSGERAGVQALIKEKQPKAIYTHCAGHSFNLAILNLCSVPPIRNCVDQIKGFTLWVKYSCKREGLLKHIVQKWSQVGTKQSSIKNVCITQWVDNIDDSWTAEDKRNALAHMKMLESFDFLYSLVTLFRSLLYIKEAVIKLQGKTQDHISGMSIIEKCCTDLKQEKEDVDNFFQCVFSALPKISTRVKYHCFDATHKSATAAPFKYTK